MKEPATVKYTSPVSNYTGIMYGYTSLAILDESGKEVMHTGARTFNDYDNLVRFTDEFKPITIPADLLAEIKEKEKNMSPDVKKIWERARSLCSK